MLLGSQRYGSKLKKQRGKKMARQKCEVFSRSMGFIRPIENFNIGKRSEFEERKTFKENIIFSSIRKLLKKKG